MVTADVNRFVFASNLPEALSWKFYLGYVCQWRAAGQKAMVHGRAFVVAELYHRDTNFPFAVGAFAAREEAHELLYERNVRDNIMLGKPDIKDEKRMLHAAKQAAAHNFIMKLPHQFDQILGYR